jgi:hypothetical protein
MRCGLLTKQRPAAWQRVMDIRKDASIALKRTPLETVRFAVFRC